MIRALSRALVQKERRWYKRKENIDLYVDLLNRFRESPVQQSATILHGISKNPELSKRKETLVLCGGTGFSLMYHHRRYQTK